MLRPISIALLFVGLLNYSHANEKPQEKPTYEYAIDLYGATNIRIAAREWMAQRNNQDVVPALIRSLRYFPEDSSQTIHLLESLTGHNLGNRWFDWFVWMETNPTQAFPNNELYLSKIFSRIDPQFKVFFYPDIERRIRLDEITWGGVRKDGIPALTNPNFIPAKEAKYLNDRDLVFGIEINGDVRAYPYRIMDWHEMFNDVIGGVPVSLAYCTLCGSGILYKTEREDNQQPLIFGSSGFLYRSNKLMYDQETHTLWNQFSGKPVVGPLVNSDIVLEVLPVVTTTWKEWSTQHPGTKVLDLNTGYKRDYSPGAPYGAYFVSDELMFPAAVTDHTLQQKEKVFGLRISGNNKAWPLKLFETPRAINDHIGIVPIVIIGDAKTSTIRAYRTNKQEFTYSSNGKLVADDQEWQITEDELISTDGERLSRLPGHIAYWFAWSNYFPNTLSKNNNTDN
ncbi:MAG: DUF3179 domain-containing protein [Pseudomonadota bacterium]